MSNHSIGCAEIRNGGPVNVHCIEILFSDPTATAKLLVKLKASTVEPIAYRATVVNVTASDAATSHALAVGITGTAYNDIISAANLKSAAGTNTAAGSNPIRIATTDTTLYAVPTIVGAVTAGRAFVVVESWPLVLS